MNKLKLIYTLLLISIINTIQAADLARPMDVDEPVKIVIPIAIKPEHPMLKLKKQLADLIQSLNGKQSPVETEIIKILFGPSYFSANYNFLCWMVQYEPSLVINILNNCSSPTFIEIASRADHYGRTLIFYAIAFYATTLIEMIIKHSTVQNMYLIKYDNYRLSAFDVAILSGLDTQKLLNILTHILSCETYRKSKRFRDATNSLLYDVTWFAQCKYSRQDFLAICECIKNHAIIDSI